MAKPKATPAEIDKFINQLRDIEGNYKSLVEKLSKMQFEADEKGLKIISDNLGKPAGQAPDNAALIGETIQALEKLKSEQAEAPPAEENKEEKK